MEYVPEFHENNNTKNENMVPRAAVDYSRQQIMHFMNSKLHYSIAFNFDSIYPGNSWKEQQWQQQQQQRQQQQWLDMDYSISSGLITRSQILKTPFFTRYFEFLPWGNCNRSKTTPKKFSWKNFNIPRC